MYKHYVLLQILLKFNVFFFFYSLLQNNTQNSIRGLPKSVGTTANSKNTTEKNSQTYY
jgi:hypothetical protein